jgi:hypothetical protein
MSRTRLPDAIESGGEKMNDASTLWFSAPAEKLLFAFPIAASFARTISFAPYDPVASLDVKNRSTSERERPGYESTYSVCSRLVASFDILAQLISSFGGAPGDAPTFTTISFDGPLTPNKLAARTGTK